MLLTFTINKQTKKKEEKPAITLSKEFKLLSSCIKALFCGLIVFTLADVSFILV